MKMERTIIVGGASVWYKLNTVYMNGKKTNMHDFQWKTATVSDKNAINLIYNLH